MKLFLSYLLTVPSLMAAVAQAQTDDTSSPALCRAQTEALQTNPDLIQAIVAYNTAAANQTINCIEAMQSPCNFDLQAEETAVGDACIAAGGMAYTPSFVLQCDNDNINVVTTVTYSAAACIGANCTGTDQVEASINEVLANKTADLNQILNPNGVNCGAEITSDATATNGRGMLTLIGSALSGLVLIVGW
ncbi:hypothetical protein IV203_024420 [Nitzschia inconspicua]|uniref:Uncharacterized protein n=1 Tax=Nitzschia inconspicua TaxID=303405 RepID=A0A9K3KBV0_9STRA|nr:hypothetical protein IV203_024420 [Nitzschia inconspicua]